MVGERPGHREPRRCALNMSFAVSEAAVSSVCTGICLGGVDVWPRVAAHGPNGGRGGTMVPACAQAPRVAASAAGTAGDPGVGHLPVPARPPGFGDRTTNGRDVRAEHRGGGESARKLTQS
jgi:hypothetical protein